MLDQFLRYIDATTVSRFVRENEVAFPWLESAHVLAIAIVIGSIFVVDARLIGFQSYRRNASQIMSELLPYTWTAFIVAAVTGLLMFASDAVRYAESIFFQAKLVALSLAGLNMLLFHVTEFRRIAAWDVSLPPPLRARMAGLLSIAIWTLVIFLGRWIAFE